MELCDNCGGQLGNTRCGALVREKLSGPRGTRVSEVARVFCKKQCENEHRSQYEVLDQPKEQV